jgi:hypothetical protein
LILFEEKYCCIGLGCTDTLLYNIDPTILIYVVKGTQKEDRIERIVFKRHVFGVKGSELYQMINPYVLGISMPVLLRIYGIIICGSPVRTR